mmetsp:Transcript_104313/g.162605  ORF Transcript_104313/g.162605 Transcript_104313/m.162605 type:complete len:633 (-) Transcript_104313:135-2033(-)
MAEGSRAKTASQLTIATSTSDSVGHQIAKLKEGLKDGENTVWESYQAGRERRLRNKGRGLSSPRPAVGTGCRSASSIATVRPRSELGSSFVGRSSSSSLSQGPSKMQHAHATTAAGKLMVPMQSSVGNAKPASPLTKAESDVAASSHALLAFNPAQNKQRRSCPHMGSMQSAEQKASSFLEDAGNMYSPKTCSVVAGTRASGSASPNRRLFKKRSPNKLVGPFDAELENTNLLEWFEEAERIWQENSASWNALAKGDESASNVLDLFQDEQEESNSDDRSLPAEQCEDDLENLHQIDRWLRQEARMDRHAMIRREGEERRLILHFRERITDSLVEKAGSPSKAYKALDHNNSGRVSLNEFDGGMRALGVKWEEITGLGTILEVFRLFDQPLPRDPNKDDDDQNRRPKGYLTFGDLFPLQSKNTVDPLRMSTPDFWDYWCSHNKDVSPTGTRYARWESVGAEEKLAEYKRREIHKERTEERKNWMRGMIHRLKHNGKSDARCREIVALHLPKGSGPKDLEGVQTFSKNEVRACGGIYMDKVRESGRKIEASVYEMHNSRTKLRTAKQQLYHTTEEPHVKAKQMEDAKTSLMQLGGGSHGLFKREHQDEEVASGLHGLFKREKHDATVTIANAS